MGSRSNYVVVDGDGWRLHHARWGTQPVDVHLAARPGDAPCFGDLASLVGLDVDRDPRHRRRSAARVAWLSTRRGIGWP